MDIFLDKLKKFSDTINVDSGHTYDHFIAVYNHVVKAIPYSPIPISEENQRAIKYSAFLHNCDDHKFFPDNKNYENARALLEGEPVEFINLVIYMISLVSCSKNNGSSKDISPEWLLYPRIADRLEASGLPGIDRCLSYGQHMGRPMYEDSTPRVYNEQELEQVATPERFMRYCNNKKGEDLTTMAHMYDKVLHITRPENMGVQNKYFLEEGAKRHKIVVDYVINFWKNLTPSLT